MAFLSAREARVYARSTNGAVSRETSSPFLVFLRRVKVALSFSVRSASLEARQILALSGQADNVLFALFLGRYEHGSSHLNQRRFRHRGRLCLRKN